MTDPTIRYPLRLGEHIATMLHHAFTLQALGDRITYDLAPGMAQTATGPQPVYEILASMPSPTLGQVCVVMQTIPGIGAPTTAVIDRAVADILKALRAEFAKQLAPNGVTAGREGQVPPHG